MNIRVYSKRVYCPDIVDFAKCYPQYAHFANGDGRTYFDLLTSPDSFIGAAVASELGLSAISGVAEACQACAKQYNQKLDSYTKQFIGAVICCIMEANGYQKTGKKKSINHPDFTKGEFYRKP